MDELIRKQGLGTGFEFGDFKISMLEGAILASFFPEAKEMTIKEIQERCGYSYERVNSAMKSLAEKKIVEKKEKGKTLVYSLIFDNLMTETIGFGGYMLQRRIDFIKKHKILSKAIKDIESNPYITILILFGSYSKNTQTKNSDIDLMVVTVPGKEMEIESFIKSFTSKYGFKFAPAALSLLEFPKIKKENKELWSDLKLYGIVFKGNDDFYYGAYKE
jgi:predicted nucleotidyltransferase